MLGEKYENYEDVPLRANLESLKKEGENCARPFQSNVLKAPS